MSDEKKQDEAYGITKALERLAREIAAKTPAAHGEVVVLVGESVLGALGRESRSRFGIDGSRLPAHPRPGDEFVLYTQAMPVVVRAKRVKQETATAVRVQYESAESVMRLAAFVDDLYAVAVEHQKRSGLPMCESLRALFTPAPKEGDGAARYSAAMGFCAACGETYSPAHDVNACIRRLEDENRESIRLANELGNYRMRQPSVFAKDDPRATGGNLSAAQAGAISQNIAAKGAPTQTQLLDAEWNAALVAIAKLASACPAGISNDAALAIQSMAADLKRRP